MYINVLNVLNIFNIYDELLYLNFEFQSFFAKDYLNDSNQNPDVNS